jgi:mannitol/fructose-specific phosphotransferase system IIA component|tara:strand:+ start:234 stop:500 length:267 start_codon:yes stop_codon:yes gene_type:complete
MARTLIIGNEIAVPTTFGAATSLAQATVLRVVNVSGSTATIGVSTLVGAATTNFITIPDGTVEYIEKKPNDVVYGTGTSRAAKVGYTG